MTIPIRSVSVDVYQGHDERPNVDERPDFTIPSRDIQSIEISARVNNVMDETTLTIHNRDGRYRREYPLQQADRIEFVIPMEPREKFGHGYYGGGMWGGAYYIAWTGRITDLSTSRDTPDVSHIEIEARDYPADILSNRKVTNSYVDWDVGAIIRDICRKKTPEIDVSLVPDLGVTTDVKYSSADCWDAVCDLAARADALVVPEGQSLRIHQLDSLPYAYRLVDGDMYLPLEVSEDDDIKNTVRIDAGTNRKLEDSQPDVAAAGYKRLREGKRILHRLRARKSAVHSVDLYVRRQSDEDDLTVRLQSDEVGEPVAIDDEDSDIASAQIGAENLPATGDWVQFTFDGHTLADRDPWMILESGEVGHDIAHGFDDTVSYRSYYPHPMNFEVIAPRSIDEYGMREVRIERENLKTLASIRDAATTELSRQAWPNRQVSFEAASERTHFLSPGDQVAIFREGDGVEGLFIVSEVDRTWDSDSVTLVTEVTVEWRKGLLAPNPTSPTEPPTPPILIGSGTALGQSLTAGGTGAVGIDAPYLVSARGQALSVTGVGATVSSTIPPITVSGESVGVWAAAGYGYRGFGERGFGDSDRIQTATTRTATVSASTSTLVTPTGTTDATPTQTATTRTATVSASASTLVTPTGTAGATPTQTATATGQSASVIAPSNATGGDGSS